MLGTAPFPMGPETLYPYPFDPESTEVLTLRESVAVMRELEHELSGILTSLWRWPEVRLSILARAGSAVTYEVEWQGRPVGSITVDPGRQQKAS